MLSLALLACTPEETSLSQTPAGGPTWHQDVAPIVSASCGGCHTEGAIAGNIPFETYEQAAPYATLMASHVENGIMPPFPADETAECENPWGFMHDPRPSEEEQALLSAWASAGAPEGDPEQASPLVPPEIVSLSPVDQELVPDSDYLVPPLAEQGDTLVCVVLDPGNTETKWLTGVALVADETAVVHHAVVYLDPEGQSEALAGPDGRYECFGGPNFAENILLAGFAPGSPPMQLPEGAGLSVPAGAKIVVQMHYHGTTEARSDRSKLQLAWSDGEPEREAYMGLYGNASSAAQGLDAGPSDPGTPAFFIPADSSDHTERMRFPIETGDSRSYGVFLVANHMHLVGRRMRAWVEHSDGSTSCLLDTPRWDFDWQMSYVYDVAGGASPIVRSGDTLVLECTYDNTLDNPGVVRALGEVGLEDPVDVTLGEETLDEMCIFLGGVVPLE